MCGIAGIHSPSGVDRVELQTMADTLRHRGPDDEGFIVEGCVGLACRRLSIIDVDGGHQPISNEDGTVWIVFNGEIYNYRRLRAKLKDRGHQFRTETDTEVIVHLYEEYGEQCVDQLNGMFAFAIWDEKLQKLFLARDRLGQKPLFYTQSGDQFLFASEIKALLAVVPSKPEIDWHSVSDYLSLRFVPSPRTLFQAIYKLPAAHVLAYRDGQVSVRRYWNVSFKNKLELSEDDMLAGLRERLIRTVESHLVSDVPVGAFLSGGMDSSMIVAILARDLGRSPETFSVGVAEADFDELPHARTVAQQYRLPHSEESVDANLIQWLPHIIRHLDEPSDPVAACQFFASRLAARNVKVALGGDGGDELFAGFDRYRGIGLLDYYALIPPLVRERILGPLIDRAPDNYGYKNTTQKLRWMHQLARLAGTGERYAEATSFFRFNREEKQRLFSEDLWTQTAQVDSSDVIVRHFEEADSEDVIDRMLYADFQTRLPEHSLMLTDRLSMAHGLESRAPFLDHELVEYLAAFPSGLKIRGRQLKYILRKLAAEYLPEEIVGREKQGFMFPVAYWFRDGLGPTLSELLQRSYFVREGFFDREAVSGMIEDHVRGRKDNHTRLWMLLNLDLWHRIYFEGNDPEDIALDTKDEPAVPISAPGSDQDFAFHVTRTVD